LRQDFNINAGAKYFADTLKDAGGNVLKAIGYYNGWYQNMTMVCLEGHCHSLLKEKN
jgi:hypothetical protein